MKNGPDIKRLIIDRSLLIQSAQGAIYIINKRTLSGKFLPGSTGGSEYSTHPLPLPAGALTKAGVDQFNQLLKSGEASAFKAKSGRLWIVLEHGYKQLRELVGKETEHVTLSWTGSMLRGLTVTNVNTAAGNVDIGWKDQRERKKAEYHNDLGAGKSKVTHKFVGLTRAEVNRLNRRIEKLIKPKK